MMREKQSPKPTYAVETDILEGSFIDEKHDGQLEKNFSLWSTCAFQFTLICSALAIGTFLSTVIGVGGSPVLIFGSIVAFFFDLIICYSLAELASAYPHSSAQVHWTYCLAPDKFKRSLSFLTGILSCAGWIFACFSSTFVASMFILSLAQMYHPDYIPASSHYYLVYLAVFLSGYFLNVFLVRLLPIITNVSVGVINFGTLFILITLLVKSPKQSADFVFKNILNETGWSSNGLVFFLGLLPSLASVTLFDGAVHMTDEIAQPERNIPLVMVISNTLSAVMAFFAAIVYMFCVVNVDNLSDPLGGQPIVQLMYDSFHSEALTTIGVVCLILTFVGSSYMYYASTSRLIWSFAASNGLPFSKFIGKVSHRLKSPVYALTLLTILCIIIGTLIMGSSSALNAVLGTSMVCVNLSYLIPIACLLVKTNFSWSSRYDVKPYFCLGNFGLPMNIISVLWVCFIMVWLNFPLTYPVTSSNMNYACVVLGITCLIGGVLWVVHGRKNYEHNIDVRHY
ncbi:HNM1 Choline transport protein [Candida maltosa Xu316]|uniref:Putative choline and nitrogen mustard permease n=1 Tax=Candida maltosa (strain Xu316) TaxID=1245528 RepID=M3J408_CANMX|nr:putative choline and nitrogen mustard permease [Candida maltosa Xu316]